MSGTVNYGRQDCGDMHSWGPGTRTCYVLHYIIRGKGTFINGSKSYALSTGESFLIRPFDNIAYYPDGKEPWEYTWIEFDGEKYISLLHRIAFSRDNCIIGAVSREKIMPLFNVINGINHGAQRNTVNGTALAILGVYADLFENRARTGENECFDSARSLMENNFYKPDFDLSAVCDTLCISRATLHRCFVRVCATPPGAYLMKYRLDRAKEFLERGFSVKSTALSCGFSDSLYFSKVFKASVGISPGKYKKNASTE